MALPASPLLSAAASRLIVCEGDGHWSAALRKELADPGVTVWECRRLDEAWSALAESPSAFVIAEATAENLDELLDRLARLPREFPAARAAVVADRGMGRYEWLVREAAAVHFVVSPRLLPGLVRIVVRHAANAPLPVQSLVERIWATLPWAR